MVSHLLNPAACDAIWDHLPMLHHVALEVRPDQMAAEGEFWRAVGFESVAAPETLGEGFDWYEQRGTQVHLMEAVDPATPPTRGHIAVVEPDIDEAVSRLEAAGFTVNEARHLWGERRVKTASPSGQVVEIMAAPPGRAGSSK